MIHNSLRPNRKSVRAVVISAVLLAALVIPSRQPLADEGEYTLPFGIVFSIPKVFPTTITLDVTVPLTPPDTVVKGNVILVPDRPIRRRPTRGGGLVGNLQNKVTNVFDVPGEAEAVERMKALWGRDVELGEPAIIEDPDAVSDAELQSKGYMMVNQKAISIEGKTYKISRWIRRDQSSDITLGQARGVVVIGASARVPKGTDTFLAEYVAQAKPQFILLNPPTDHEAREEAGRQFVAFRKDFQKRLDRLLKRLNAPRHLMGKPETLQALRADEGGTFEIHKFIKSRFFGKPVDLKVDIEATIAGSPGRDTGQEWDK